MNRNIRRLVLVVLASPGLSQPPEAPPVLIQYEDRGGWGIAARAWRVSFEEAAAAFAASGWGRTGQGETYALGTGGVATRLGSHQGFLAFLDARYEQLPLPGPVAATACTPYFAVTSLDCGTDFPPPCYPGPSNCYLRSLTHTVTCPGACTQASCERTTHVVLGVYWSRLIVCDCFNWPYPVCQRDPQAVVTGYWSTGPLCHCQSVGCSTLGPGRVGYSEEITCLTPPRIGTVFTLGHRATFLVVGSCYNTPPLLRPPGFPDPSILWVQPQTVLTPGSQIVLPNNPALVGVQRCIQTAVNTSRGWEFTAGVQVTVLQ